VSDIRLIHGDCLDILRTLPDASVDSVVTDPPYGLEFMGKEWDAPWKASSVGRGVRVEAERASEMTQKGKGHSTSAGPYLASRVDSTRVAGLPFQLWCQEWAAECLRVLKPGGHLLSFGGTRTWHRLACAVEDAGFEVRDSIAWLYGSGFPKSLDVSKAIDKRPGIRHHREFADEMYGRRLLLGYSTTQVSEAVVGTPSGACWNWEHHQFPEAKWWPKLKAFLHMDDKWDAIIAEAERAKIGERTTGIGTGKGSVAIMGDGNRDLTANATPDAERWQGWGTALKPAFEPIVVARKPLGGSINIRSRVEHELRQRGVEGEIVWTESASGVVNGSLTTSSGATPQQPVAATSARTASETATGHTANGTETCTGRPAADGAPTTLTEPANSDSRRQHDSETPSLRPTVQTAPAVASQSQPSLSSTTSTEGEPHTAEPLAARSTSSSDAKASHLVIESFAGIATGLTDSATVRIDRTMEGFIWPAELPEMVVGGSTVAANVLTWGTGALNVDACRIGTGDILGRTNNVRDPHNASSFLVGDGSGTFDRSDSAGGRWPANVVLDETQADALDLMSGEQRDGFHVGRNRDATETSNEIYGARNKDSTDGGYGGQGGASRFFYVAKADASERVRVNGTAHPTVKPLALMRWLVRLVTPPGGTVLEPFAGSGTTVEACILEGFSCIAIEREAEYLPLIQQRIDRRRDPVAAVKAQGDDNGLFDLLDGGAA
jgi:DNA modification methylase